MPAPAAAAVSARAGAPARVTASQSRTIAVVLMRHADVGRLLSLISHEVRGPFGVMRGYLRLLDQQGADLPEAHRRAIAAALRAGDRAMGLLTQVSELARLQRGELVPTFTVTDLEPLLQEAVRAVVLPAAPVVTVHVGDTPAVAIMADAGLLRSAFTGLITAVVRAQPADARVFLLAHEDTRNEERGVAVTITSMEAVSADHLEQPLDVARGGLGLDLPIAAFIIEAHRGQLTERRAAQRFVAAVVWLPIVPPTTQEPGRG